MIGALNRWVAGKRNPQPQRSSSSQPDALRDAARREVVAIALRDTLRKHGIPGTWVAAEASPAMTLRRERGMHMRLMLREWQPELLAYAVPLQETVKARIFRLDPSSAGWLTGLSWNFDLVDGTLCPTLPDPGYWRHGEPAPASEGMALPASADPTGLQGARGEVEAVAGRPQPDGFRPTQPMSLDERSAGRAI